MVKPLVPEAVLRSGKSIQAAFLRGLLSADGNVAAEDGKVTFYTSTYELAHQVRLMLRSGWGFETSLTRSPRIHGQCYETKNPDYWHVTVRGSRRKFQDLIGFTYTRKEEELSHHLDRPGRRIFSRVREISFGSAEVFDLEVEDDPSYVANGFVSHNSADSIQALEKRGFLVDLFSVDRNTGAYDTLVEMILQRRIDYGGYGTLIEELEGLVVKNGRKIDHRQGREKDTADAVAAACYHARCAAGLEVYATSRGLNAKDVPKMSDREEKRRMDVLGFRDREIVW